MITDTYEGTMWDEEGYHVFNINCGDKYLGDISASPDQTFEYTYDTGNTNISSMHIFVADDDIVKQYNMSDDSNATVEDYNFNDAANSTMIIIDDINFKSGNQESSEETVSTVYLEMYITSSDHEKYSGNTFNDFYMYDGKAFGNGWTGPVTISTDFEEYGDGNLYKFALDTLYKGTNQYKKNTKYSISGTNGEYNLHGSGYVEDINNGVGTLRMYMSFEKID